MLYELLKFKLMIFYKGIIALNLIERFNFRFYEYKYSDLFKTDQHIVLFFQYSFSLFKEKW